MVHLSSPSSRSVNRASKRGGFTLIEILVAVAIMSLLLSIIMVPLRLAFETFHIGKARGEVQQQAQLAIQQVTGDLRRAKFVFPNSYIPGVSDNTDVSTCSLPSYRSDWNYRPYVRSTDNTKTDDPATTVGVTGSGVTAWENPSRIDMLLVRQPNGETLSGNVGEDYMVTYYTRRLDMTKAFDVVDNPVVLFRAQYPYRYYDTTTSPKQFKDFPALGPAAPPANSLNALLDNQQYPAIGAANNTKTNRNFLWITHNFYGEANLEPLCVDYNAGTDPPIAGAHTLVIPRDMALVTPRSNEVATPANAAEALIPELSFVEEATSGKRIDRVTINMTLAQYDQSGVGSTNNQEAAQRVRVSRTIDLPNAGCAP